MRDVYFQSRKAIELATVLAGLFAWSGVGAATDVSGQARAVQATVLGITTVLVDTGTLAGRDDARESALLTGSIPTLGSVKVPHATTISSGLNGVETVVSEASLGNLNLGISGHVVSADFVMARARTPLNGASTGVSSIDGLTINGQAVSVSGAPNQTIPINGGRVVINEHQASANGMVVNALHIVVDGVADVVVASASSGITSSPSPATNTLLPVSGLPPL